MAIIELWQREKRKYILLCKQLIITMLQRLITTWSKNIYKNIWQNGINVIPLSVGEVAEWSIAAVLKTVELRGSGGSNPSLSARLNAGQTTKVVCFVFVVCRRLQATATHRKNKPPRAIALHPAVVGHCSLIRG